MECKKLFHLDSLMRTRLTPDSSKLIMSTSGGFYLVIHDLDLDALASDFEDHDPSEYADILQNGSPHDLKGHRSNEMFHRPRNRAEIVMDFPKEGSGQCISSLVVHPQAWCMVSRYTNDQEDQEVGRGDWTFAPVRILTITNMQFGQEMALVMQTMHAQRWQYPNRVYKHLFPSIQNVHRYHKNP